LTDKQRTKEQTDRQTNTQTDTTENNTTLAAQMVIIYSPIFVTTVTKISIKGSSHKSKPKIS